MYFNELPVNPNNSRNMKASQLLYFSLCTLWSVIHSPALKSGRNKEELWCYPLITAIWDGPNVRNQIVWLSRGELCAAAQNILDSLHGAHSPTDLCFVVCSQQDARYRKVSTWNNEGLWISQSNPSQHAPLSLQSSPLMCVGVLRLPLSVSFNSLISSARNNGLGGKALRRKLPFSTHTVNKYLQMHLSALSWRKKKQKNKQCKLAFLTVCPQQRPKALRWQVKQSDHDDSWEKQERGAAKSHRVWLLNTSI